MLDKLAFYVGSIVLSAIFTAVSILGIGFLTELLEKLTKGKINDFFN